MPADRISILPPPYGHTDNETLRVLSLRVTPCLCRSKTGVINFTEVREWMTGRMKRKAQARNIHLLWNRTDGMTLMKMKWTPKAIKREIVLMLQRAELAPLDLVRAWDQSKDFSFSQREFLIMMKHIVYSEAVSYESRTVMVQEAKKDKIEKADSSNEKRRWMTGKAMMESRSSSPINLSMNDLALQATAAAENAAAIKMQAAIRGRQVRVRHRAMTREEGDKLWYGRIKPVIIRIFEDISGGDGTMDMQEFVQWLNEEWRHQKMISKGIEVPGYGEESEEEEPSFKDEKTGGEESVDDEEEEEVEPEKSQRSHLPGLDTSQRSQRSCREVTEPVGLTVDVTTEATSASQECLGTDCVYKDTFFSSYCIELKRSGRLEEITGMLSLSTASSSGPWRTGSASPSPSCYPAKRDGRSVGASPTPGRQNWASGSGSRPQSSLGSSRQSRLVTVPMLASPSRPLSGSMWLPPPGVEGNTLAVLLGGSDAVVPGGSRQEASRKSRPTHEYSGLAPAPVPRLLPSLPRDGKRDVQAALRLSPRTSDIRRSVMGLPKSISQHVETLRKRQEAHSVVWQTRQTRAAV